MANTNPQSRGYGVEQSPQASNFRVPQDIAGMDGLDGPVEEASPPSGDSNQQIKFAEGLARAGR